MKAACALLIATKGYLQAKAANAKKAGVANVPVTKTPSKDEIEAYKAKVAARKKSKRGKTADRFTSAQNSRHVDRKMFKMRELRGAGFVAVKHVPTEINPADIFTKILSRQPFEKHRRMVLNLATGDGVAESHRNKASTE